MKTLPKLFMLFLVFGLILGFAGCPNPAGDDEDDAGGEAEETIDFTNHESASIRVRNNTNQRLVAFRGKPDNEFLLGGIPANASNHGLSKDGFTTSVDFALTLMTEAEYNRAMTAGGNDAVKEAAVFNVIYAFYNHSGTNNNIFAISARSGGAGRLIMENPTAWNIELRQNAYNGQTLGFIGPFTATQTLNLEPGDYIFYPVMRRFNPLLGEIIDVQPAFMDGVIADTPYFRPLQINESAITWNFREIAEIASVDMVSGGAFIRVVNNSSVAIQFYQGSTAQQTSMLSTFLNPGQSMTFQIRFPPNPDGGYSADYTTDFGVGVPGVGRTADVPARKVDMDWLYEIKVSGTTASNVSSSVLEAIQEMDIEGLFNAE